MLEHGPAGVPPRWRRHGRARTGDGLGRDPPRFCGSLAAEPEASVSICLDSRLPGPRVVGPGARHAVQRRLPSRSSGTSTHSTMGQSWDAKCWPQIWDTIRAHASRRAGSGERPAITRSSCLPLRQPGSRRSATSPSRTVRFATRRAGRGRGLLRGDRDDAAGDRAAAAERRSASSRRPPPVRGPTTRRARPRSHASPAARATSRSRCSTSSTRSGSTSCSPAPPSAAIRAKIAAKFRPSAAVCGFPEAEDVGSNVIPMAKPVECGLSRISASPASRKLAQVRAQLGFSSSAFKLRAPYVLQLECRLG